jgi:RimJ/RimL family protein N-acetyltransferase
VLDTARDLLDVEQVQLTISTQNEASYGLYLRLGFTVFGTELHSRKIGDSYVDQYHMVKFLK